MHSTNLSTHDFERILFNDMYYYCMEQLWQVSINKLYHDFVKRCHP